MLDALLIAVIRRPRLTGVLGLAVTALLLATLWWFVFWQNPQRAFADMLTNNLAATSVTKVATAQSSTQSVEQYARLQMGSTNLTDWLVTARQQDSAATTESIGTPTTGYIRYTQITLSQRDAAKHLNFANVVNIWGKSDGKTDPTLDHLFAQTLLDISSAPLPPIANLPAAQRQNILDYLRQQKVFQPAYAQVKQGKLAGRQVYLYSVSVQLGAYVRMMQAFAHDLGLNNLDSVDPNQYSTLPPVKLQIAVDKASHELAGVTYPASNFAQRYTDWGLMTPITIPAKTISTTELQAHIQAAGSASS